MRKPDQRRTASWGQAACASGSSPLQNMFRVDGQIKGVREFVEVCGGLGWDLSLEWCNITMPKLALYSRGKGTAFFYIYIFVPSLFLSQSLLFLSVSRIEVRANKVDILVWSERQIRVMSKHMLEGRYMRLIIKFDAVRKRTISSIRIITVIVLSLEQNACRYI